MDRKINLDTQAQLVEDEKAKAKARYNQKLLADQEEQIKNLLMLNNMEDPRNARVEMKPKKEYSHFEDNLPSGEDLMALLDDPKAVEALSQQYQTNLAKASKKDLPSIAMESKEGKDLLSPEDKQKLAEAAARDMGGYQPGYKNPMEGYQPTPEKPPINPSGVIAYGSKTEEEPEFHGGETPRKDQTIDKYRTDMIPKKEEVEEKNWWLEQMTPKVDEALKAIADRYPEAMMLPEVKELLNRSHNGYRRQAIVTALAPFTSNPQMWMGQANTLREQGDKNLMEAAANLEAQRTRQLEAAKATADNLTSQKGIAAGMHNAVLGLEGNLAQVAIPSIQQANDLELQAEQVHEQGDAAIGAAIQNMQTFVQRLGDMGVKPKDVAVLMQQAEGLNPSNIREFIKTVNGFKPNTAMRKEFNERLNQISTAVAQYETAMVQSNKMRQQAQFQKDKASGLMNSASNLGGEYKIPEWMNAPVQASPESNSLSTPFSDEKSDVPASQPTVAVASEKSAPISTPSRKKSTPISVPKSESGNSGTVTDPWYSVNSIQKLSSGELDNLFKALYNADTGKAVKGAKVGIYQTEQGAEGNAAGARRELAVAEVAQNTDRFINSLDAWANSNTKGLSKKLNALKNVDALNYFKNKVREGTALRQLLDNATNSDIRGGKKTSFNFGDQEAQIASLLMELGYV